MDAEKMDKILRGTLDPSLRERAEEELDQAKKIIGFCPSLLQLVMSEFKDMPVRQAGVIYLKNMVTQFWKDAEYNQGEEIPFHIHEQDRALIRESIIDAIVHAPEVVSIQLAVAVYHMAKNDFPGRWSGVVDKIHGYLQGTDGSQWLGAYRSLYQVVKTFEYKKKEDRGPINECMKYLLPIMQHHMISLMQDASEGSVLIQKLILKIIFAYTQFTLSLEVFEQAIFTQWMEIVRNVVDRDIPEEINQKDEEELPELPWWKVKKWALHVLTRIFDRYGNPNCAMKEYKQFGEWFIKTFSEGFLQVVMKTLNNYHMKKYVSPRVLRFCLSYIDLCVGHAHTWKLLKPHAMVIVQNVVFPLMCHSDYDEDLWNSDPIEYVRVKGDIYEDIVSPVTAGQGLLLNLVMKRKTVLEKTMTFVMSMLDSPNLDAKQKEGIFHMIGSISSILNRKKGFKEKLEVMVARYVFPEFTSPHGYLRSRSCWLLRNLEDMKYSSPETLKNAVNFLQQCLLQDSELPVQVEASLALSAMLESQDNVDTMLNDTAIAIVEKLVGMIKETESDDVTNVLCKFVAIFSEQLIPIAANMCMELAATFQQVVQSVGGAEDNTITAMGLLGAIETLINCMEEDKEVIRKIEPVALQVVGLILSKNIIEYYEEAFSLLCTLTLHHISNEAWQCYELVYKIFKDDGFDYFTEMMPALHNYLTVDTSKFLENEAHLTALLDMCKTILTTEPGEDEQCHAAKLLECIILQCKEVVNPILPQIIEMAVTRLMEDINTTELRTMLLQVLIAGVYIAPEQTFTILEAVPVGNSGTPVSRHFIDQWIKDVDSFFGLHDRKICILGMCTLLQLGPNRVPLLGDIHKQLLPSLVLLFQGIKKAYKLKALEENEDGSDEEEEADDEYDAENDVLSSDEDEEDQSAEDLFECIENVPNGDIDDDEDSILLEEELSETTLESYCTPIDKEESGIDEYWVFKTVMQGLEQNVPAWYQALTATLNDEQKKEMIDVGTLADQRRAAQQSKKIEESGGYSFIQQTVPSSFNFGSFQS